MRGSRKLSFTISSLASKNRFAHRLMHLQLHRRLSIQP